MKDNRWLFLVALAIMSAGLVLAEGTVPPRQGIVNSNSLAVRPRPASFYERLGVLNQGAVVQVLRQQDDWYEILLPENILGWVRSEHLNAENIVINDTCFLHTGAGEMFTNFHHIPVQTKLTLAGIPNDGWCQVIPPAGTTAWVSAAYISFPAAEGPAAKPDQVSSTSANQAARAEISTLEAQRNQLKEEHARQQAQLEEEQQRLKQLRADAEKLKQATMQDANALGDLQREVERLQLLRENAEVKAALARAEREKALLQASEEQKKLEQQKLEAELKAKTVLSEKDKWEAEARKVSAALTAAREESRLQAETARTEADKLEQEKLAIVEKAEAALKKAQEAEERRRESEQKQSLTEKAIQALQADLQQAEKKVESLRQERERMEAATKEEATKLEQVRQEAERLARENAEIQQRLEAARQERLALDQQKLEDEKRQQTLKAQVAAQDAARESAVPAAAPADGAVVMADGRQRILLSPPAAGGTASAPAPAAAHPAATGPDSAAEVASPAAAASAEPVQSANLTAPPLQPRRSGIVISLQGNASAYASHVLCESRNYTLVPICYLHSSIIDLRPWENLVVEVTGEEITIKGWTRPVLKVDGIIRK
ncbi:MAG: SH3 domain-containing protein [Oligosphaeraceae bacterium]|nr:SH3 domain-containing protein [Oligosphaeraceae bacterium]